MQTVDERPMAGTAKRRFATLEEADQENIFEGLNAQTTKRQTTTAVNIFREYLTEKGLPLDFETLADGELDEILGKFYMEMRNKSGELYKKTTMQSYRQGLQRHLSKSRDIDILKGESFKKSQKAFVCMTKELKRKGLAVVDHYPAIAEADMRKMYEYFCSDLENAQKLQYKVNTTYFHDMAFVSYSAVLYSAYSTTETDMLKY